MRLKNDAAGFAASFNITPPYQMVVLHSSVLIYPREVYQRGVQRKRVELIASHFNEYTANEPKVASETANIMWWMASTPSRAASSATAARTFRFSARSTPA